MRLVTISAQYGAGGSSIAPAVAEALGLPFVDRAIPVQVARELGVSMEECLARDDRAETRWMSRWLAGAARVAAVTSTVPVTPDGGGVGSLVSDESFVAHTEKVIRGLAGSSGAVVLGRAAAIVLADRPDALHVRLHGPRDRRLRHAMVSRGIDAATAQREMDDADRARASYVKRFYRRDPDDAGLYHLVCDSTALPSAAVAELITSAARAMTPSS